MQNDMLKHDISPSIDSGRWYKMTLNNVSGSWVYNDDESDFKGCSYSGSGNITGDGPTFLQINDIKVKIIAGNTSGSTQDVAYLGRVRLHTTTGYGYVRINLNPIAPAPTEKKIVIYVHGFQGV